MDKLIQTLGDNLKGRGDRKEFWIGFLIQMIASAALLLASGRFGFSYVWASVLTLPVWLFYANRRFHDLGLTGWLGLAPFGFGFVLGIVMGIVRPDPEIRGLIMAIAPLIVTLGFLLWLGCTPGQRGSNRFGPPPGQEDPADSF